MSIFAVQNLTAHDQWKVNLPITFLP